MGLSISGLGSGFDWQSTVDQLRQVENNQRINPLNTQKTAYQDKLSAWQTLTTKLSALQTAASELKDSSGFGLYSSTLSSSSPLVTADSLLTATAGSGAAKGRYDIIVSQLAQAEQLESKPYASNTADAGETGSLTINGSATPVSLDGKSLTEIRDAINALNTGTSATGVTASILKVSTSEYRLLLSSDKAGETAGAITLTGSSMDRATYGFTSLRSPLDAEFIVNGSITIKRPSNTVGDAIPGVTLTLKKQDPATTVTVDVDQDSQAIQGKIQKFIDAYNDVMGFIDKQTSYDSAAKKIGGPLFADSTLKSIKSTLQSTIVNGGLNSIVKTISGSNNISLDTAKLSAALQTDFSNTVALFNTMSQSLYTSSNNWTDSISGTVTLQQNSIQNSVKAIDAKITATQSRIDRKMEMYTAQFIAMDSALNQMQAQQSYLSSQLASLSQ
jgi:flagellar hook-associated protein 2